MKLTRSTALVAAAAALVVAGALVLGLALRGPGPSARASVTPLSFFPADARWAIHVPDVARVGAAVAALQGTRLAELAAMATGSRDPEEPIREAIRQLGFDPRSPESMAEAGIDPARGLAFGEDEAGAQLLAVAVSDEGRFARYADALAKRLGAATRAEEPLPAATFGAAAGAEAGAVAMGTSPAAVAPGAGTAAVAPGAGTAAVTPGAGTAAAPGTPPAVAPAPARPASGLVATVHRAAGTPGRIVVAHLLRDGYAVLAAGGPALEALARAVERSAAGSLAASPAQARARERLGPADVYALVADARTLNGTRRHRSPNPGPAALGLRIARGGLGAKLLLPGPRPATPAPTAADPGAPLLGNLPPETFLAARLGGDPAELRAVVDALLPRGIAVRLERAGLALDRDVLDHLRGAPVLGIGLLPMPDLSGGLPGAESRISNFNPFRLVTVSLFARVRDPAAARAVLERLAAEGGRFEMEVATREEAGEQVYTASYAAGEGMTWGLVGDVLVAAGSADAFAAARARLAGGAPAWAPADPAAAAALARSGASVHLDLPKLAAAVKAIPESAFGVGGFQIKDSLDNWTDLVSDVKGATLVFAAEPEGLVLDVEVGLR